ncbi:hypothetical protein [Arcobacter caeni]|nr:hypothetical protein [Arcobacter caeni]
MLKNLKMNLKKLKDIEEEFLTFYPTGFEDAKFFPTMKKFNPSKLEEFTKENLKKENFSNPNLVVDAFFKIIQKSVLISLFDKLKFRDMLESLTSYEKDMLSIELYELLHGNIKNGFDGLVDFLKQYNLAKWTIISVILYYNDRQKEYFVKPTTTKNVIKYFEIKDLVYKPTPSFEFYNAYKKMLNEMKKNVHKSLSPDNAAFTGFLRIGMED